MVDVCPAENDDVTPSSTDVEPASERRDLESQVSQQPEPQATAVLTAAGTHQVNLRPHQTVAALTVPDV